MSFRCVVEKGCIFYGSWEKRSPDMVLFRSRPSIYLSIYSRTIHRFVYYRVPPGSSPITANFSIRKLSGAITFDRKGLFSICKKPLVAKDLFFRFDTRVGAVSGGAGAWLGPKSYPNIHVSIYRCWQASLPSIRILSRLLPQVVGIC